MNDKKLKTTEHAVAYIDLLGVGKQIKNDVDNANLNLVRSLLSAAMNMCTSFGQMEGVENIKLKAFSDNIILAIDLDNMSEHDAQNAIDTIATVASFFQLQALYDGLLVRGSITVGFTY